VHKVAVGALVRDGRVLLGYRSSKKRAYPSVWDLPGGVVEAGESELGALARELHEELGVQIATASASHLCRLTAGPAEERVRLSAWLVREWQGTPTNAAPDEHDDIGWFDLEELPSLALEPVRAALIDATRSKPGFMALSSTRACLPCPRLLVDFWYGGSRARLLSRCSAGRSL
jgi:mutator protein MutT